MAGTASRKSRAIKRDFVDVLEDITVKCFANPYGKSEKLVFEQTQDAGILSQYYHLRNMMYRNMSFIDDITNLEDGYDRSSNNKAIIARRGRLCFGGVRMTIREGNEDWKLPLERKNPPLAKLFPYLPLADTRHAQISGLAFMDDCGESSMIERLYKEILDLAIKEKVGYLFTVSTPRLAKIWQSIGIIDDIATTRICREIELPEDLASGAMKWLISVTDLAMLDSCRATNMVGENSFSKSDTKQQHEIA